MAIAGVPPLNGFASEWLTLQALVRLPLTQDDAAVAWRARGACAGPGGDGGAGAALLREGRRARAARRAAPAGVRRGARGRRAGMRAAVVGLAGAVRRARRGRRGDRAARWPSSGPATPGWSPASALDAPGTGSLAVARARRRAPARRRRCCGGRAGAAARRAGARVGVRAAAVAARWSGRRRASRSRCGCVLEAVLRPRRELVVESSGGVVQEVTYQRRGAAPVRHAPLRAGDRGGRPRRRAVVRRLQSGNLRAYLRLPAGARRRPARAGARRRRSDERGDAVAGLVELARRRRAGAAAARARADREGAAAGPARRRRRCSPTASCGGCGGAAA